MPTFKSLAKAIIIGMAGGVICSAVGMTMTYASTGVDQLPKLNQAQQIQLAKGDTK